MRHPYNKWINPVILLILDFDTGTLTLLKNKESEVIIMNINRMNNFTEYSMKTSVFDR